MPLSRMSHFFAKASMAAQSARYQLKIALALITVVPLLSFAVVVMATGWMAPEQAFRVQILISAMALLLGLFGYAILRTYPANIERMVGYLESIAQGELPDYVQFSDDERDIVAIEGYLNAILDSMRSRIHTLEAQLLYSHELQTTIQEQSDELIAAERQRVMVESLGAACHHIGQPAAVLRMYLTMLKETDDLAGFKERVDTCLESIEAISDVLDRLRRVTQYRTVPYVTHRPEAAEGATHGNTIVHVPPLGPSPLGAPAAEPGAPIDER